MDGKCFESKRRLVRRRMAVASFIVLVIESIAITAGMFVAGPLFAANIAAAAPVLNGLFLAHVGIVGGYLGVSLIESIRKP